MSEEGNNDNWREGLPTDMQTWDEVKNADSLDSFYSQVGEMRSSLGQSIRIPSKEAGAEGLAKFHEKVVAKDVGLMPIPSDEVSLYTSKRAMGMPESADGYQISEELASSLEGQNTDFMRGLALKAGLTQKEFNGVMSGIAEMNSAVSQAAKEASDKEHEALRGEWGAAADQNYKEAAIIAEKSGAPADLVSAIKDGTAGAEVVKWMHGFAQNLEEGGQITMPNTPERVMTPAEASEQLQEIYNNPRHPYNNEGDPAHQSALQQVVKLNALINAKPR